MIVTNETAFEALRQIRDAECLGVDTETTGLRPYINANLFSIIISTENENFYWNFQNYPDEGIEALDAKWFPKIAEALEDNLKSYFLQNAKFDMAFLHKHKIYITGPIYDLKFLDRVHNNQHKSYSLDEISKRWGSEKLDIVKKYVEEHKLKEVVKYPELNKEEELHHYELVPFKIMAPYGEQDGGATLEIGQKILIDLIKEDDLCKDSRPRQMQVVKNESRLVHTLFDMERIGIKMDRDYCWTAVKKFQGLINEAEVKFKAQTGLDFVKGTTVFEEVFASERDKWILTEKKNWKWDKKVLSTFTNPAAQFAAEYAEAKKQLEYFQNFLWFADEHDIIHPGFDQAGTVTGRLSAHSPNMQNMTNPDKYEEESESSDFPVRAALVPRDGFFFAMLDYKQIEYRVFLDIARASSLIDLVLSGLDVHEATTRIAPVTRKQAKTVNFLTLYGGGAAKLAGMLFPTTCTPQQLQSLYMAKVLNWRVTPEHLKDCAEMTEEKQNENIAFIRQAMAIQKSIFDAAPEIKNTTKAIQKSAESRGYIFNWLGRRYQFSDKTTCYRAPNHLIQGNCADILKVAMNQVHDYLLGKQSRMILTIHDELVIEVKFGEEFVIDEIKKIMESVYPYKRLPLAVDVEYSLKNLADKQEWTGTHLTDVQEA